MVFVYDKAFLDEDDIANANIVVYGKSDKLAFNRFGPRVFFSAGTADEGHVMTVHVDADNRCIISAFDATGAEAWQRALRSPTAKVSVLS